MKERIYELILRRRYFRISDITEELWEEYGEVFPRSFIRQKVKDFVEVGVAYSSDVEKVKELLIKAVSEMEEILKSVKEASRVAATLKGGVKRKLLNEMADRIEKYKDEIPKGMYLGPFPHEKEN